MFSNKNLNAPLCCIHVRTLHDVTLDLESVLTVSRLYGIPLDETITNTYFLAPFYCSGRLIHCLEISGSKNNSRTI